MAQDESVRDAAMARRVARAVAQLTEAGGMRGFLERLHPRDRGGKWRDSFAPQARPSAIKLEGERARHETEHVSKARKVPGGIESKYDMPGKRRAAAGPSKHAETDPAKMTTAERNQAYENARGSSPSDLSGLGGDALKRDSWANRPINHSSEVTDDSGKRVGRAIQARGKGSKGWLAHHHTKGNVGTFEGKVEAENAVREADKSDRPALPRDDLEKHMATARAHEGFKPETPHQKRIAKRIAAERKS